MSSFLLHSADVLVTMDDAGTEISDGAVFARDGVIEQVGHTDQLPQSADTVVNASGTVVTPGLVNTHHHFYQTLTRAVPGATSSGLFDWLTTLYPIWAGLTPETIRISTKLALTELAMSGCTTAFDHNYIWPNGTSLSDQVDGASEVGIRVTLSRGSMSLGESDGGLPPDRVVEDENEILDDCIAMIDRFHDPGFGAMIQVAVAPCSPFSVTTDLMKQSAALARDKGVRLHTHLAETADEDTFCLDRFGARPLDYAAEVDWLGEDVWLAHGVHVDTVGISKLSETRTGVAHCPTSNMRLASGLAPLVGYLHANVPVGIGVDGSASNDSSNLLHEARQALLSARLSVAPGMRFGGQDQLDPRTALRVATRGGAEVLGRTDIGSLEIGKACDLAAFPTDGVQSSGVADPVAGLLLSPAHGARHVVVAGARVISDGRPTGLDLDELINEHSTLARKLVAA